MTLLLLFIVEPLTLRWYAGVVDLVDLFRYRLVLTVLNTLRHCFLPCGYYGKIYY